MCGIAGFLVSPASAPAEKLEQQLKRMTRALAHRGPDDSGVWSDHCEGIYLGHRRLAVIDLSPAGHQPMVSASGRYVLVYNGEIYNHRDLRAEVEQSASVAWRGRSDTEELLAAFDLWGIDDGLIKANGMFAFAAWDRREQCLVIARDRLGEKPLYFGAIAGGIAFGSELKAITTLPGFERVVDRESLHQYTIFGYVPGPRTIWQGISKLPPGHILRFRRGTGGAWVAGLSEAYWDIAEVAHNAASAPFRDEPELVNRLESLLLDAVGLRMEADVPLGSFLSGGVDSSLITAMMQAQSARPVKTFSIGFDVAGYDESAHARAVAAHLGTDHRELRVDAAAALETLPLIPHVWDEPFADSSQIPTFIVNKLAREDVTVALSGDGGDELFAGYNRHVLASRLWKASRKVPRPARDAIARLLSAPGSRGILVAAARGIPGNKNYAGLAERLPKIGAALTAADPADLYAKLVSIWPADHTVVLESSNTPAMTQLPGFPDFRNAMLFMDTVSYLPDDILVKVDRAGMAVSLEGRIPFLDHRLVEFAWKVPLSAKIRDGRGKHILREVLYRYVPRELIDRPKAGFAVPIGAWLRNEVRGWAEALLDTQRIREEGYFKSEIVAEQWLRFLAGDDALLPKIWTVLMFQAWLEHHARATDQVAA